MKILVLLDLEPIFLFKSAKNMEYFGLKNTYFFLGSRNYHTIFGKFLRFALDDSFENCAFIDHELAIKSNFDGILCFAVRQQSYFPSSSLLLFVFSKAKIIM